MIKKKRNRERPYNARGKRRKFKQWKVSAMGHQERNFLGHQMEVVVYKVKRDEKKECRYEVVSALSEWVEEVRQSRKIKKVCKTEKYENI